MSWSKPIIIALAISLGGCASGPEPAAEAVNAPVAEESSEESTSSEEALQASSEQSSEQSSSDAPIFELTSDSVASMSYFRFGADGGIFIGYEDSRVGILSSDQSTSIEQIYGEPYRVLTVNEAGNMAMLESQPGMLVRVEDQEEILRMNELGTVHDAAFSLDGSVFVAAVEEGRVHIWHRGEELLRLPDETIQKFLDRQMPDFTAQLAISDDPLRMTADREILRSDQQGRLAYWNPRTPREIRHLANFESAPVQISVGDRFGVAATERGEMGVFRFPQGGFYRWSMGMDAEQVFAHRSLGSSLIVQQEDRLKRISVDDGEVEWEVRLPTGQHCGLEGDEAGERLLVCIEGQLAIVSADNGDLEGMLYRTGGQLNFQTP